MLVIDRIGVELYTANEASLCGENRLQRIASILFRREFPMADSVRRVTYCNTTVSSRAGQGARVLSELKKEGVNLAAFTGFPTRGGKAQLDFIAENMAGVRRVARKHGWRLSKTKKGFLIQGKDQIGAAARHIQKLADKKINITAADAVCAGKNRYGMILWVKPKDYARAARTLKAR
jgi:hypothetical protein